MAQLYTIPPAYGFAKTLARGLLTQLSALELAQSHIFVPTRRAARTLQQAFVDAGQEEGRGEGQGEGRARSLLLPRLSTLGDVEVEALELAGSDTTSALVADIPPAMSTAQRLFLLARLIDHSWEMILGPAQPKSFTQVFAYARALMALLDSIEIEGLRVTSLSQATPTDPELEGFWERAGRFIALIQELWPGLEQEAGRISAATRRRLLLEAQARQWQEAPPAHPVIMAGTTATIPSVRDLAAQLLTLPQGQLVLPGLDSHLEIETWDLVRAAPSHPQHGLIQLLDHLGCAPADVLPWHGCDISYDRDRHAALSRAQRPLGAVQQLDADQPYNLQGLVLAEAQSPEHEARTIALFLREALEDREARAALVTPDRDLAGRVAAELRRWNILVDDSAGLPLAASTPGRLAALSADTLGQAIEAQAFSRLLSHPLVTWGQDLPSARAFAQAMDLHLRGQGKLQATQALDWPQEPAAAAFQALWQAAPEGAQPLVTWLDRHLDFLETLCPDPAVLWRGPAGETLAQLFETLRAQGKVLPALRSNEYADLLHAFLRQETYRQTHGTHPRVIILGTLEARLLQVDALALGGLNEGTWPRESDVGPWMNRPTRALVGLPSPERKIGLAAHDLAQALASPRVLMTRTLRIDGTPTLPCRWIERLKTVTLLSGQAGVLAARGQTYLDWAQALDQPPAARPTPQRARASACPPLTARPSKIQATDVGLLVANPYGFYAKRILRLRALPPRGPQPAEQTWGLLVHDLLDQVVQNGVQDLGTLQVMGQEALERQQLDPAARAPWEVQLTHCLAAFWQLNQDLRGLVSHSELKGQMHLGSMIVEGRADRVVELPGKLHIIDYKTGNPASKADQESGLDPQLCLLGLIAEARGFTGLAAPVVEQAFWRLPKRAHETGREISIDASARTAAQEGLIQLFAAYSKPNQAYVCAPFGDSVGRADPAYDDYAHLARRALA